MNLRQLRADIEELGLPSPAENVDKIYQEIDYWFDWSGPLSEGDFKFFMSWFRGLVAAEKKRDMDGVTSPASRADLIRYIVETVIGKPQGRFAGVEKLTFAVQLALRMRRPRTVNQSSSALCGPASFIYNFAKTQPQQFVQFALDLFFNGHALLGTMEVEPSAKVLGNYPLRRNKIPWAVDYVTLVSLRQCTFLADAPGLSMFRGADETTLPGQLAAWLSQAGYSNVQDHTFFAKNQQKAVAKFAKFINQPMHFGDAGGDAAAREDRMSHARWNLQAASYAVAAGNVVFFFIDGDLAEALKNKRSGGLLERKGPTALGSHHWITIRRMEIRSSSAVGIKAFTWGETYQGWFEIQSFLSRYNGYICAEP